MSALLYGGVAAFQLASSYFAAQNVRDAANLNNEISEWNAEFAELDAHDAVLQGETDVAQYQANVDAVISDQNVAFAVQDVDANYGSAGELSKETRFMAEINRMEIEKQASEKALGYKRQARDFRLQGDLNRADAEGRASGIQAAGVIGALGTLSKIDYSGYGPKYSGSSTSDKAGTKSAGSARNEVTGYQSLTRDF